MRAELITLQLGHINITGDRLSPESKGANQVFVKKIYR